MISEPTAGRFIYVLGTFHKSELKLGHQIIRGITKGKYLILKPILCAFKLGRERTTVLFLLRLNRALSCEIVK